MEHSFSVRPCPVPADLRWVSTVPEAECVFRKRGSQNCQKSVFYENNTNAFYCIQTVFFKQGSKNCKNVFFMEIIRKFRWGGSRVCFSKTRVSKLQNTCFYENNTNVFYCIQNVFFKQGSKNWKKTFLYGNNTYIPMRRIQSVFFESQGRKSAKKGVFMEIIRTFSVASRVCFSNKGVKTEKNVFLWK